MEPSREDKVFAWGVVSFIGALVVLLFTYMNNSSSAEPYEKNPNYYDDWNTDTKKVTPVTQTRVYKEFYYHKPKSIINKRVLDDYIEDYIQDNPEIVNEYLER